MQPDRIVGEVVIVGGGPVGNFTAVLCGMLGVKCTVYEKRDSYLREINIKIEKDFFKQVDKVMRRVSRKQRAFFKQLNDTINEKNGKIMLKNLETSLKQQAENLHVKYIKKQIKSFQQVQQLHKYTEPIILDCTGRNSLLRTSHFGPDSENMKIYNLHHALHINFEAIIPRTFDFKLIYPVIKNSQNLKLGQLIVSKNKSKQKQSHFTHHVTVPLFISNELSQIIDTKYPNINRKPLKPFSVSSQQKQQSEQKQQIVKQVQDVFYALFCTLVMADWEIQWDQVVIKKINITCGYSIKRSHQRFICLGDSAAHFAYFKSLNFGLKHAFEFVKILSRYHGLRYQLGTFDEKTVVNRFWKKYLALWPTKARQGPSAAQYFVTNSQIGILTPYIYDISNDNASRIDILPQIKQHKIDERFQVYEQQQKSKPWSQYLKKFQQLRQADIDGQIFTNRSKKAGTQLISYFIWINSLSPIKFSETMSYVVNGYYLQKKDFDYFGNVVHNVKGATANWYNFHQVLRQHIDIATKGKNTPANYEKIIKEIRVGCEQQNLSKEQFCASILKQKIDDKSNKNKDVVLLLKGLQIVGYLLSRPVRQTQSQVQKQELFYSIIEPQQKQEEIPENRQKQYMVPH